MIDDHFFSTRFSFARTIFISCATSLLLGHLPLLAQVKDASLQVRASDYCCFLNAIAKADPDGLYEERMGNQDTGYRLQAAGCRLQTTGPETAVASGFIIRSGLPGSYHYDVAEGKEDAVINYVSPFAMSCYRYWKQSDFNDNVLSSISYLLSSSCEAASQLRSNRLEFCINDASELISLNKKSGEIEVNAAKIFVERLLALTLVSMSAGRSNVTTEEARVVERREEMGSSDTTSERRNDRRDEALQWAKENRNIRREEALQWAQENSVEVEAEKRNLFENLLGSAKKEAAIANLASEKALAIQGSNGAFENLWKNCMQATVRAKSAWDEVVCLALEQASKKQASTISSSSHSYWNDQLDNALHHQSRWMIQKLWNKAQKMERMSCDTLESAIAIDLRASSFQKAWNHSKEMALLTHAAWEKVEQAVLEAVAEAARNNSSEPIQSYWANLREESKNWKTVWGIEILLNKAHYAGRMLHCELEELMDSMDYQFFDENWSQIMDSTEKVSQAFLEVSNAQEQAREEATPQFKLGWMEQIESTEAAKINWAIQSVWCKALQAGEIPEVLFEQAIKTDVNNLLFKKTWEQTIAAVQAAAMNWKNVTQVVEMTMHNASQKNQDFLASRLEVAKNQQHIFAAQISWYEAQKAEAIAKFATIDIARLNLIHFNDAAKRRQQAMEKISCAETAWKKAAADQENASTQVTTEEFKTLCCKNHRGAEGYELYWITYLFEIEANDANNWH